jgi:DNA-binding response OmpR family regulator
MPESQGKILLVEDDPIIVRTYQRKLTVEGFDVSLSYNGEEGLAAIKVSRPDIILMDIMMPKMNGIDTLKKLKADDELRDIPVVILTNLGDRQEDVDKCKAIGAEDYWVKANTSLREIVEKVKIILARK